MMIELILNFRLITFELKSTKDAKSIKEVKKASEKDLRRNKSVKITKTRQDNNN